jgi:hypothetical protein
MVTSEPAREMAVASRTRPIPESSIQDSSHAIVPDYDYAVSAGGRQDAGQESVAAAGSATVRRRLDASSVMRGDANHSCLVGFSSNVGGSKV